MQVEKDADLIIDHRETPEITTFEKPLPNFSSSQRILTIDDDLIMLWLPGSPSKASEHWLFFRQADALHLQFR